MATDPIDRLKKVLFISGIDGDTRRYRCFHQQEQLDSLGITTEFRESDDPQLLVDVLDYDVFVLHRVPYNQLVGIVIDIAHLRGKPVIFETDDLVFDPALYEHIGFVDTLSVEDARKYRNDLARLTETFQRCDCVLTTTQFLADEARRRDKPAYVHRNAPSSEMVRISEQAFAARHQLEQGAREPRPIVVAFFSGTGSHNRDFKTITETLVWVLETYPQVQFHISGHLDLEPELLPFLTRIRKAPYVSWRELPHLIARVDINLAPLEKDNPFCQAKSENKLVEAALVGIPTIASRVDAYEFAITDGEDGFLAGTPEQWKAALKMLLENPEKRREIGKAARRTVYARYMPEQHAPALLEKLQTISLQYGGPSATREQILQALAGGAKQYADQIRTDALNQETQIVSLRQMLRRYEDQLAVLSRIIEQREQTIEAIMQGRVMRLMTGTQRWLRRVRGRS